MPDNKDLPVYPQLGYETTDNGAPGHYTTQPGISQRTLIAAMCLQGLLGNSEWTRLAGGRLIEKEAAERATTLADALLIHLQNTDK